MLLSDIFDIHHLIITQKNRGKEFNQGLEFHKTVARVIGF